MDLSCDGLRVAITAAGSGIGRVTAESFLAHGARLLISDVDEAALEDARRAMPGVTALTADAADEADVNRFFDRVEPALGGLDVLVNNAGIAGPTLPIEEIAPADWRRTMAVNIDSMYLCARRAVPMLKAAGGGSMINLSSAAGLFGYPLRAPYATSKWAVIGLTETLAMELGPHKIRVNAVCPGMVAGPRIDGVIAAKAEQQGVDVATMRDKYLSLSSLHTTVSQQDIANMILFLASPAGGRISGQSLSVDGNMETLRT